MQYMQFCSAVLALTPNFELSDPPGLNESKRNVNNLNLLEGIKSASVSSETLVFYSDSKNYSSAKLNVLRVFKSGWNFDPSVKIVRSYVLRIQRKLL